MFFHFWIHICCVCVCWFYIGRRFVWLVCEFQLCSCDVSDIKSSISQMNWNETCFRANLLFFSHSNKNCMEPITLYVGRFRQQQQQYRRKKLAVVFLSHFFCLSSSLSLLPAVAVDVYISKVINTLLFIRYILVLWRKRDGKTWLPDSFIVFFSITAPFRIAWISWIEWNFSHMVFCSLFFFWYVYLFGKEIGSR